MIIKKCCFVIILMIGMLVLRCTSNPFFKDDEIVNKSMIKGQISLSDGSSSEEVLIWLENTDMISRARSDGMFSYQIPAPNAQSGSGLNGIFKLYFYLADYTLDSAEVFLRDGLLEFGKGDINKKGKCKRNISLNQRLKTTFVLDSTEIGTSFSGRIKGTISFQALLGPVQIFCPIMFRGREYPPVVPMSQLSNPAFINIITGIFLLKESGGTDYPKLIVNPKIASRTEEYFTITDEVFSMDVWIEWPPIIDRVFVSYDPGSYRIYPYFVVEESRLPQSLWQQIWPFMEFNAEYLTYPIKHSYAVLKIR